MAMTGASIAGFVVAAAFVWLVFDNLALGLLFGLLVAVGVTRAKNEDEKA